MSRLGVALLAALALASTADAKPLLGVLGNSARFTSLSGQTSAVHLAFLGWGQGLSYGSSFVPLFHTLGPIPMIHLNTTAGAGKREAITPAQIAAGKGDGYLVALNEAIAQWGSGIYVRPMAEMNNSGNAWSGFTSSGQAKPGHSPADYRKAFQRIYLILHGGLAATINTKLASLGMPGVSQDLAPNPFPRLRVVWNPLAGGSPRIPANAPRNYYPGSAYVDVEGIDIYDERGGAPWQATEDAYTTARSDGKPFAIPEFGLIGVDDPAFVTRACRFLKTHTVREASFYEGRPGGPFDLATKPRSRAAYRSCIPLVGATTLPAWATVGNTGGGTGTAGATIAFTLGGRSVGSVSAPIGADGLELDMVPATGVIAKGYWIRGGRALAAMAVPAGATGAEFDTTSGATSPAPLIRPRAGTDFHVQWSGGTITSTWWSRVGKLLATIPVTPDETSVAFTQGS